MELLMKYFQGNLRVLAAGIAALIVVSVVAAQESRPVPRRTVIHAGQLLDVRTGKMLRDQDIVVEEGLIKSVGAAQPAQETGTVINLRNATVLPGLIDAHDHITGDPSISDVYKIEISNARRALKGARNARVTLFAGFTTIRNVGADGYPDIALRDAINDGDVIGPHILAAGPAITTDGGSCDNIRMAYQYHYTSPGVADGVEGVQHKVREVIKYGADVIKMCATGGLLSPTHPGALEYSFPEMQMIVAEAHRHGRRVAAHAHGAEGIRLASEAGVDSIEHGFLIDEAAIATMKKNGTYLVPTAYVIEWIPKHEAEMGLSPEQGKRLEAVLNQARGNLRKAFAAGLKIAFGTDAAVFPHGENAHEFEMYVDLGMTPLHAIQTATINGADLLGLKDKTGVIEPGKWADIIAVDGDPTVDVRTLERVKFVMKSGIVYKNEYAAPPAP
jgi:imidazolonepropionase-like amidohydrolase